MGLFGAAGVGLVGAAGVGLVGTAGVEERVHSPTTLVTRPQLVPLDLSVHSWVLGVLSLHMLSGADSDNDVLSPDDTAVFFVGWEAVGVPTTPMKS